MERVLESSDTRAALRERIKELTCLYGIAKLADQPGLSLEALLQSIAELLPPAWQHPDRAFARITLDAQAFETAGFRKDGADQTAAIVARGKTRGSVTVGYPRNSLPEDEAPFLREEEYLINEVARQVSFIVDRVEAEQAKEALQAQLRHADRLATIGQLAAGIAHELNEPLGSILGFAQLVRKAPGLQKQVSEDAGKIEAAALHAREVIKKLMLFARPSPPREGMVDLNMVVRKAMDFHGARCEKNDIKSEVSLDPSLSPLLGDESQLRQVVVNLVVNATQAMPRGGELRITTRMDDGGAILLVEDTGIGMIPAVVDRIFDPFFTTKDVDEGTGLGLAVVHGIVTSHEGTIDVTSEPGKGTRFAVYLPLKRTS